MQQLHNSLNDNQREYGAITGIKLGNLKAKEKKRKTSPEKWEESRLKYHSKEFTPYSVEMEEINASDSEDVEIDLNDFEPPFLKG